LHHAPAQVDYAQYVTILAPYLHGRGLFFYKKPKERTDKLKINDTKRAIGYRSEIKAARGSG
jgi:hypothetical protein